MYYIVTPTPYLLLGPSFSVIPRNIGEIPWYLKKNLKEIPNNEINLHMIEKKKELDGLSPKCICLEMKERFVERPFHTLATVPLFIIWSPIYYYLKYKIKKTVDTNPEWWI